MKHLFAYIRVSTPKQGRGVSLKEQKSAIEAYAERTGVTITEWFEEKRTAAKAGRPEFSRMVKLLRRAKADGVVIHKVDRSTRNFRDWADIDELIEAGIDVYFANETLDLRSRGGRLAADIQVVVAVDYIRNLREEALKGIHGRLKQGILPHHAPIGYLDCGAGKPKTIDPVRGPIVRKLFELYATGSYSVRELTAKALELGLRNRNGNLLRLAHIHKMLRTPFYAGVIRSKRFGLFAGAHEVIVRRALFDRVQAVLNGKFVRRTKHYDFLFRRLLHCETCGRSLIGSERKGRVYYRCSTVECPTTSVREDAVDHAVREMLRSVTFEPEEADLLKHELAAHHEAEAALLESRRVALSETISVAGARLQRLTDLLLDGKIDADAHDERRNALVLERHRAASDLASLSEDSDQLLAQVTKVVELAREPLLLYETADVERKRQILRIVMSNCVVSGKTLAFSLHEPFATIAKRSSQQRSGPHWNTPRTLGESRTLSAAELLEWCATCPTEMADRLEDLFDEPPLALDAA